MMRRLLAVLVVVAWALALVVLFAPIARAGGYGKTTTTTTSTSTTTTTVVETTTTTAVEETTTQPTPDVEVCRDGTVITVPADEVLESDERIWDDFDRADCQPPRTPPSTTIPTVEIDGPPYSVGYICPGTDGVVQELPWGTYDNMFLTPAQAAASCPITEIPSIAVPTTDPGVTVETLPFTGSDPGPGLGLAIGALLAGGILLWLGRKAET